MNHNEGMELLFEGSKKDNLNKVKKGLRIVKDVNIQNEGGWTPLHCASTRGKFEIIKYLISNGADINIKNNGGIHLYILHHTMEM